MIIDSPIISGSYAATGSLNQTGDVVITGSLTVTGTINASITGSITTASYALNAETLDGLDSTSFVTTSSFNTVSGSFSTRVTNLESFSSSLDATFATDAELAAVSQSLSSSLSIVSGSLSSRVTNNEVTGSSLTTASSSFSIRVTNNEATGSSLVTASGSFSTRITNLETASGSFSTRTTNLETASGSFSTRVTNTEATASNIVPRVVNLEATASSLTTASSSFSTRVTNTEATASSLVTASGSFSTRTTNLETASGSFSTRTTNLETASGSFSTRVTSAEGSITSLNSRSGSYATTGSNAFSGSQVITGSLTTTGTITAQTLNVQQVTSSIVYSSGSNIFGNSLANTQIMTGSVSITGSLTVTTTATEFQVGATGVTLGNVISDVHNVTGSLRVSGSVTAGTANVARGTAFTSPFLTNGGNLATTAGSTVRLGSLSFDAGGNGVGLGVYGLRQATGSSWTTTGIKLQLDVDNSADLGGNLFISSNGNVGIGTTNPTVELDVVSSGGSGMRIIDSTSPNFYINNTSVQWKIYLPASSNDFRINDAVGDYVTIRYNSGNVGIGTTANINQRLVVQGTVAAAGSVGYTLNGVTNGNQVLTGESSPRGVAGLTAVGTADSFAIKTDPLGRAFGTVGLVGAAYDQSGGGRNVLGIYGYALHNAVTSNNTENKPVAGLFLSELGSNAGAGAVFNGTMYGVYASANSSGATNSAGSIIGVYGVATGRTNDTTYGGYFAASGGTTNYGLIVASGNVGIGTTSPGSKLEVNGSFIRVQGTSSDQFFLEGIRTGTSTTLRIYDNSSVVFYDSFNTMHFRANQNGGSGGTILFNGGYFGINNTAPATRLSLGSHLGARLPYIDGTTYAYNAEGITVCSANNANAAIGQGLDLTNTTYSVGAYSPIISFSSRSSNGTYNASYAGVWGIVSGQGVDTNWISGHLALGSGAGAGITERMRITSGGNVGIGTSSPGYKLDVYTAGATSAIRVNSDTSQNSQLRLEEASSVKFAITYVPADGSTRFFHRASDVMALNTNGNLGIGTTSADRRVVIYGGSTQDGIRIDASLYPELILSRSGTYKTYIGVAGSPGGYGTGTLTDSLVIRNSGVVHLAPNDGIVTLTANNGNVGIGITSPATLLDVRSANTSGASGATIRIGSQNHGGSGDEFANLEFFWGDPDYAEVKAKIYTKNTGNVGPGGGGAADLLFATRPAFGSLTEYMRITSGGNFFVNVNTSSGFGSAHRIYKNGSEGDYVLSIDGGTEYAMLGLVVTGGNYNAAKAAQWIGRNSSTLRSINAGGTINASGTDYAEYMIKAITDNINKGDIVGINSNGLLTNIFDDSISFVVKSTDPSYVGGDTWGSTNIIGTPPGNDATQEEKDEYNTKLQTERAKVDRIAFSGQVPCNVYGANVGDYIIPIKLENGKIGGQAVSNPTFEQYQKSVGKVWKVMEDGRAWIAVKIG